MGYSVASRRSGLPTLVVLGGTGDAVAMTEMVVHLYGDALRVIYSLAGVTSHPRIPQGAELVSGGFGGASGFERYLTTHSVTAVINATHPFAQRMSQTAFDVTHRLGLPFLRTLREEWRPEDEDHWIELSDLEAAAHKIPFLGKVIMLAIGTNPERLAPLKRLIQTHYVVRASFPPQQQIPLARFSLLLDDASTASDIDREISLMRAYRVDALVCKNSGSHHTATKLLAARSLGLPAIVLRRPPVLGHDMASSFEDVVWWVERVFPRIKPRVDVTSFLRDHRSHSSGSQSLQAKEATSDVSVTVTHAAHEAHEARKDRDGQDESTFDDRLH